MNFTDPGDQEHGVKRRGVPQHKHVDQVDAFSDVTPAPANSGPSTRAGDPATSRAAARRAAENMTAKQLAVLTLFQMYGAMNDEQLCDHYRELRATIRKQPDAADLLPEQTDSGIRSRRAELTAATLAYLVPTGEKRRMKTGGVGSVHRLRNPSESYGLDQARRLVRLR